MFTGRGSNTLLARPALKRLATDVNDSTEFVLLEVDVEGDRSLEIETSRLRERQRALRSAWGVLSPSGLSSEKSGIAEAGRALSEQLVALSASDDPAASVELDVRFDALEAEMREVAFKVPIGQLRSSLPQRVSRDRRGVLDLLDLMLGAETRELAGTAERIPSIDYLITLLCVTGGPSLEDPVHLTPRIHELCGRSADDYDPRLPEIEAEFFAAADLYEADARSDHQHNALHRRKAELGSSYFAPSVLRAIVTYNAALLERIDHEVIASQDWGEFPHVDTPVSLVSVFENPSISQIAQALQRRAAGKAPGFNPIDRIAWCLDLDFPDRGERRALMSESIGDPENAIGTAILVGLLCRSAVVLEEELSSVGIAPEHLTNEWITELANTLQRTVNERIASDEYEQACVLSELKNKFLYTSMANVSRTSERRSAPGVAPTDAGVGHQAKKITDQALEIERVRENQRSEGRWRRWAGMAAVAVAALGLMGVAVVAWNQYSNRDLASYDRDRLDEVSPYLSRGKRSGQGVGPAFVGEIRDGFDALEPADRMLVATDLVGSLREQGVSQIMIYGDSGDLRIQAFGDQRPRVAPAPAPR